MANDLPSLGGRTKDIVREARKPKPLKLKTKAEGRAKKPLHRLKTAEKVAKSAGKKGAIARVLGSKLGARLLPALAIAMTLREVSEATKAGKKPGAAYRDLALTKQKIEKEQTRRK